MVIMEKLSSKITDLDNYRMYRDTEQRNPIIAHLPRIVNVESFDKRKCKGKNPNMWFAPPENDTLTQLYDYSREAKQLCDSCPIRLDCFDTAIDNSEEYGIWGGIDIRELRLALILFNNNKNNEL